MSQKHIHEIAKAQIEVNKEEAKGSWFQSSGDQQPWVCVAGFAVNFLISPLLAPLVLMYHKLIPLLCYLC